jgi:outer membrane protein OmpA-like peptidoglycan-associated protein
MASLYRSLVVAGVIALWAPSPASAQPGQQNNLDAEELINQLQPRTRGIRVPGAPPPATAPAMPQAAATTAPADTPAASLSVHFATGSVRLTPAAERTLDELGRALASQQLSPYRFRIEGHTDTVGSRDLNQSLSERRAVAVREYLAVRHGVSPTRLEAIGFGESQLLVATPDETAEVRNRRVQVINLGS